MKKKKKTSYKKSVKVKKAKSQKTRVTKKKKKIAKKGVTKLSYYQRRKLRLAEEAKSKLVEIPVAVVAPIVETKPVEPPKSPQAVVQNKIDNPAPVITKGKKPSEYLNNRNLLAEVIKSKAKGDMTNEFAKMLMLLVSRYAKKGNWASYTYNEDMQGYAIVMLVKTWKSFDPTKGSNPFAFYTQCVKNSFTQYLNYEQRQRDIKDKECVNLGLSPSYNYQYEYSGTPLSEQLEAENVDIIPKQEDLPTYNEHDDDEPVSSDTHAYA